MKTIILGCILLGMLSCKNETSNKISKAFVYARQDLNNGKILLFYRFQSAHVLVKDTAIVENIYIPQDSIPVRFNEQEPQESQLLLAIK
ncbi:MAG: hypothetical protein JSS67_10960 [Bacteroidetes bacterium]|nr:hypothetical protein [Bacteroidota bacterium]